MERTYLMGWAGAPARACEAAAAPPARTMRRPASSGGSRASSHRPAGRPARALAAHWRGRSRSRSWWSPPSRSARTPGDAPGEFQHWIERYPATQPLKIPGVERPARLSKDGVLVISTGMFGRAGRALTALIVDPRFDLSKAYWLMAGIAGVDPKAGSIGSAAWSDWVVDGDPVYEIDDREITRLAVGLYGFDAKGPEREGQWRRRQRHGLAAGSRPRPAGLSS